MPNKKIKNKEIILFLAIEASTFSKIKRIRFNPKPNETEEETIVEFKEVPRKDFSILDSEISRKIDLVINNKSGLSTFENKITNQVEIREQENKNPQKPIFKTDEEENYDILSDIDLPLNNNLSHDEYIQTYYFHKKNKDQKNNHKMPKIRVAKREKKQVKKKNGLSQTKKEIEEAKKAIEEKKKEIERIEQKAKEKQKELKIKKIQKEKRQRQLEKEKKQQEKLKAKKEKLLEKEKIQLEKEKQKKKIELEKQRKKEEKIKIAQEEKLKKEKEKQEKLKILEEEKLKKQREKEEIQKKKEEDKREKTTIKKPKEIHKEKKPRLIHKKIEKEEEPVEKEIIEEPKEIKPDISEEIQPTLDEDLSKAFEIIDELLGKLPDETIDEFVQSDDFEIYEKVVSKYKKK